MILPITGIPKLRGKNQYKVHYMELSRRRHQWKELAAWAWKQWRHKVEPLDPEAAPHDVRFALPMDRPTRADPHNYMSFEVAWMIDGLVLGGLFPDDRAEYVDLHQPILYKRREDQLGAAWTPVVVAIDEPLPDRMMFTHGDQTSWLTPDGKEPT